MKLATDSQKRVEAFLREHLQADALKLPAITLHSGALARLVTRGLKVDAITLGRRILIAPELLRRDERGRLSVPGALLAHEATHVWQYRRAGAFGFLLSYLRGYFSELRALGKLDRAARMAAYLAIKEECDAYRAGEAYAAQRRGRAGT